MLWIILIIVGLIVISVFLTDEGNNSVIAKRENNKRIKSYLNTLSDNQFDKKYFSEDTMDGVGISFENNTITLFKANGKKEISHNTYKFNDLIEAQVIEDGQTVMKTSRASQFAGAAIGGVIAGGLGAAVGGLSSEKVNNERINSVDLKLIVNDLQKPTHTVNFLSPLLGASKYEDKGSERYVKSKENIADWQGTMKVIIERMKN